LAVLLLASSTQLQQYPSYTEIVAALQTSVVWAFMLLNRFASTTGLLLYWISGVEEKVNSIWLGLLTLS
jgi:hypothetical protein